MKKLLSYTVAAVAALLLSCSCNVTEKVNDYTFLYDVAVEVEDEEDALELVEYLKNTLNTERSLFTITDTYDNAVALAEERFIEDCEKVDAAKVKELLGEEGTASAGLFLTQKGTNYLVAVVNWNPGKPEEE